LNKINPDNIEIISAGSMTHRGYLNTAASQDSLASAQNDLLNMKSTLPKLE
jgi:hypothetical protein